MPTPANRERLWYQEPLGWIVLAGLCICAAVFALPTVKPIYKRWAGERHLHRATAAFAQGDYVKASFNAQRALTKNQDDVEALRIMAKIAEASGSPEALAFRRQIAAILADDPENRLGLAAANLHAGNVQVAAAALQSAPLAEQESARYHDVAAAVALAQGDAAAFAAHTEKAAAADPASDVYQLKLAALRLKAKSEESRSAALATLEHLKALPAVSLPALRVLLSDATDRGESDRMVALSDALASAPGASVRDKLMRLSAMDVFLTSKEKSPFTNLRVSKEKFYLGLGELQKETAGQPEEVAQVVAWMNVHHLALEVPAWVATLPESVVGHHSVSMALAETYALASDWKSLQTTVERGSWGSLENLRLAYLARACEHLRESAGATEAWAGALRNSEKSPAALERLARTIETWGWNERREEVLWKLAASEPCPRWAADELWSMALRRADTPALFRLSKALLHADPQSASARINFARLAFICGQEEAAAHPIAETLFQENPSHEGVVLTYALSLFRRDRADEAVAIMARLPADKLHSPALGFYQGLFLAAAGQPDEAEKFLFLARDFELFPELEAFRDFLTPAFAARGFEREGRRKEADIAWDKAIAATQARADGWEILARTAAQWGWEEKAGILLNKLAAKGKCPPWGATFLWSASLKSGDSAAIYGTAKLLLDANPRDFAARRNYIIVALLSEKGAEWPDHLAEALYAENPASAAAAAAFGLSLYRQGRLDQALAVLRKLTPEELHQPQPALYLSFTLAAAGQPEAAESALKTGAGAAQFPEEKRLVKMLQTAFRWHALPQAGGDPHAADAAWKETLATAALRPDYLEILARMLAHWDAPEKTSEVLWLLTEMPGCPRWSIDQVWV